MEKLIDNFRGFKAMTKSRTTIVAAIFALFADLTCAIPGYAWTATCPYGGDESQSMRCFDCMKRVWTGKRWRLKNTCKPHIYDDFGSTTGKSR
jgi:hypothetical protein